MGPDEDREVVSGVEEISTGQVDPKRGRSKTVDEGRDWETRVPTNVGRLRRDRKTHSVGPVWKLCKENTLGHYTGLDSLGRQRRSRDWTIRTHRNRRFTLITMIGVSVTPS